MTTSLDPLGREDIHLSIRPNPASEPLHIEFSLKDSDEFHLRIHDAMGRLIHAEQLGKYPPGLSGHRIRLGDEFRDGLYFIRLSGQKHLSNQPFIKVR